MNGLIAFLVILQNPQSTITKAPVPQDPVAYEKARVEIWQAALADAFKPINENILVDINKKDLPANPPRLFPPNSRIDLGGSPLDDSKVIVRLMSGFLHRKQVALKDGWALCRDKVHSDTTSSKYDLVLSWLEQAKPSELRAMLTTGVAFANLSPDSQDLFAGLCYNRGLQKKMANGEFASAELRFSFVGHYKDAQGEKKTMLLDLGSRYWPSEKTKRERLAKQYVRPAINPSNRGNKAKGELQFPVGEIVSVDELSVRASKAFGRPILFDGRFSPQYCYVQGSFTRDTFLTYMRTLSQTIDWQFVRTPEENRAAIIEAIKRIIVPLLDDSLAPPGVSFGAALDGKSVRASDVYESFPDLKGMVKQSKLSDDTVFELSPALTLQLVGEGSDLDPLDPPGSSPLTNAWSATFGNVK